MTFGFSRDDVGRFLPQYLEQGILPFDPFQRLDEEGVGQLVRWPASGAAAKPDLHLGICGEHGGEPHSVGFFDASVSTTSPARPTACQSPGWRRPAAGCMGRDDALLAFDRHATSKIAVFEDLLQVGTLGFRGEALAAIAAVSRVQLVTAERPGEGWRVRLEGGRVLGVEPAARARGTTIEIASLFFNVPARRKFLKTPGTELRRSVEVVQGYCLARPDVRFLLRHEGRALLEAPAAGAGEAGRRERIRQLFGPALGDDLVELAPGEAAASPVAGLVGKQRTARPRRLFVFVNGRLVRDRAVLAAFYGAVREEWKSDEAPSLFLFLTVTPEEVDVNVHPQKAEVRFRDPRLVERVREALRDGLRRARGEAVAPLRSLTDLPAVPMSWEGLGGDGGLGASGGEWEGQGGTADQPAAVGEQGMPWEPSPHDGSTGPGRWLPGGAGQSGEGAWQRIAEPRFTPPAPVPLSGPGRSSLRLLGQYKGALLLLEAPDGLLLLDQHAAHERILYERIAAAMAAERPAVQRLLTPRLLPLGLGEALRLAELAPALAPLGFLVEPLSGHDLALVGAPAVLPPADAEGLLLRLAAQEEGPGDSERLRRRVLEEVAASRACRAAIKIHRPLAGGEMERLVADLFACEDPFSCPHGRPTLLKMADAELERRFARR
jgi:DNA mismatch repair protein MutL